MKVRQPKDVAKGLLHISVLDLTPILDKRGEGVPKSGVA